MKKLFYCAAAALTLLAASCGNGEKGNEYFSAQATDSLTNVFGQFVGSALNQQVSQAMAQDSTITKEAFLNGLQYALAADTSMAYSYGMNIGLQIQRQLSDYAARGLNIDKRQVLAQFKAAFLDSVPSQMELQLLSGELRRWDDSLATAKRAYDLAQLEQNPEAVENLAKGEAYIKDVVAKDTDVKVLPSGVAYKVENPGEDPKVAADGRAVLNYQAKRLDGSIVEARNSMPVLVSRCTPGLAEGVTLLGKGGKATLYVPGKQAYGVEVPQGIKVGLNEPLIYEVEVVDIPETPGLR